MANFLSKVAVSVASDNKNKFDLSCQTLCTQDFFKMTCAYYKELVPKSELNIDMSLFSRTAPMPRPMLSSARIVNRAFFVPYRTCMRGFNEFITQSTYTGSNGRSYVPSAVTSMDNLTLAELFCYDTDFSIRASGDGVDFHAYVNVGTIEQPQWGNWDFKLTPLGRKAMAVLNSLGIKVIFPQNDEIDWREENENQLAVSYSAMPLLAYAKVWLDWFSNPQYDNRKQLEAILAKEAPNNQTAFYLVKSELKTIFQCITQLSYNQDYFTSAWDNPTAPNSGVIPTVQLADISEINNRNDTVSNPTIISNHPMHSQLGNGTPQALTEASQYLHRLTQYADDALHALTDYVTRFRLVGSRATDRYLAEHGVQLSSEKLNRSVYYGVSSTPLQISDVVQTSEALDNTSPLGTLAGKGVAGNDRAGHWSISTDEYGIVLILSFVDAKYFNPFGTDRMWQHRTRFDFWTPDLDGLGTQAIRADEIWSWQCDEFVQGTDDEVPAIYEHSSQQRPDGVFGFTGRYNEYKCPFDNVHGDILLSEDFKQYYDWFLYRDFASNFENENHLEHSLDFCVADGAQFNKIFAAYEADSPVDNFVTMFTFKVDGYFPMKPVWDTYDFEDEDKKAHRVMQLNGTNLQD